MRTQNGMSEKPIRSNVEGARAKRRRTQASKAFSAIDGESYTVNDLDTPVSDSHRYVLLMDSSGEYIYDQDGLGSKRCFDFLLSLPHDRIYVAFGLNYDVNMMLRDFGRSRLVELWKHGETQWFNYHLEWIPGKWFVVKNVKTNRRIKINEVFGFFQCSFVKALAKWKIETQDNNMLESMKLSRSIFDAEMKDSIIAYCHTETMLLNELMDKLRDALNDTGIDCTSWCGAGSIAASILRKENVKDHIVPATEYTREINNAILSAYFGGRTELFQQGIYSDLWQYDIVSAYPHSAISLPTLRNGQFRYTDKYEPNSRHAIWHVRWNTNGQIAPFPHRSKGKRISYPLNGEGYYHACEVSAALGVFGHGQIDILDGYVFQPSTDEKPFAFIPELARAKTLYKRDNHPGEKVLKLGINSLYGKLAQGKGYRDQLPPYQSYFWAGEITAKCRSRMLRLAYQSDPLEVVMVATDGIFLRTDPAWRTSDELGGIEKTHLINAFIAQPGVYHAYTDEGVEIKKSRGFFAKEIDYAQLREGYLQEGPFYTGHYSSTRFVGLGSALVLKEMDAWRTWQTKERKLVLYPTHKSATPQPDGTYRHNPPTLGVPVECSLPYIPKGAGYLEDERDYMQGKEQPLRT